MKKESVWKVPKSQHEAVQELADHITRAIVIAGPRVGMAALKEVITTAGPPFAEELRKWAREAV